MADPGKKNLVLDLDDTLIYTIVLNKSDHANIGKYSCYPNMLVQFDDMVCRNIVYFRPHVFEFIRKVAINHNLYVYTHGTEMYCKIIVSVLTNLMNFNPFEKMYWRVDGNVITKDLALLGLSSHNTIIIDDNHKVWSATPDNVIVIKPYQGPKRDNYTTDNELLKILTILNEIHATYLVSPDLISEIIKVKNIEYVTSNSEATKPDKTICDIEKDNKITKTEAETDDTDYWKKYDALHMFNEWYT